jgi:hypothetical protein
MIPVNPFYADCLLSFRALTPAGDAPAPVAERFTRFLPSS